MWKQHELVMLPTTAKANLFINNVNGKLLFDNDSTLHRVLPKGIYQHIYITSNEKIKEGDWCIMLDSFENVFSIPQHYTNPKTQHLNKGLRKIIACTDDSLRIGKLEVGGKIEHLPQIPQSFIEKFVEEYNKGNVITKVMIEYILNNEDFDDIIEKVWDNDYKLKINVKDNTINIKPIKDSWSREEVVDILKKYNDKYSTLFFDTDKKDVLNKWVSENL